ncbi:MAG: type II toxin-antitoxin system PemK/MazF family toxin [Candidatus Micrarchaeota archaeon]|nr:type II toxin-antitoxin system PemK/MazF family toxin [Candidatus Micrarchaeota archaeon]
MSSSSFKKGKIVLVELTFSDESGSKWRPALVVSSDAYNQTSPDVVLAKISGSDYGTSFEVALTSSMLKSGELNKPSFIDLGNLRAVEKKQVLREIATVDEKTVKACDEKIRKVFGV